MEQNVTLHPLGLIAQEGEEFEDEEFDEGFGEDEEIEIGENEEEF